MGRRKKGPSNAEQRREKAEESIRRVTVKTAYMTNSKMMIPKEGWCIFKRSLWNDGQYIGVIERLICDESVKDEVAIPQYTMAKQLPVSEYEILFHPRSDQ